MSTNLYPSHISPAKVRDVQLITAKDTGRSKGFAYVELKSLDDVPVRTRMRLVLLHLPAAYKYHAYPTLIA